MMLSQSREGLPNVVRIRNMGFNRELPAGQDTFRGSILGIVPKDIQPGWYFVGMLLDQHNEVYELTEANNVMYSKDSFFFDFSVPLTLDVLKDTFWFEGQFATKSYFNVERPSTKGMIVDLTSSDKNALDRNVSGCWTNTKQFAIRQQVQQPIPCRSTDHSSCDRYCS